MNEVINKIAEDFEKNSCSDKIKRIKTICQQHFTKSQKIINKQSTKNQNQKIIRKQPGTMCCFGCKDYTQKFRPEKVKMTTKVLREKPHCVFCQSNKSKFLKQKIN